MTELLFSEDISEEFIEKAVERMPFQNEEVAVKLHMGEPKNPNHLRPREVEPFVRLLKKKNCRPFLFDTTVSYGGRKASIEGHLEVAEENGFSAEAVGCPITVGDGENVGVGGSVQFEIAEDIVDKSMLVLTHVKGHMMTGIGAAIKNVGIGCVTKKTKGEMHSQDDFLSVIAEACVHVLSKAENVYYVNLLKRMAKGCDCENHPMEPVIDDIGVFAGGDILAIDRASYDLILEKAGRDVFRDLHGVSFQDQLDCAERKGLGKQHCQIIPV